jgi:hypothetical protein
MAIMPDFKRPTWYPKDHFEKLLKAACLNHSYPIKHKLKDYTMMKIFMTSEALSKREGRGTHYRGGSGHGNLWLTPCWP